MEFNNRMFLGLLGKWLWPNDRQLDGIGEPFSCGTNQRVTRRETEG